MKNVNIYFKFFIVGLYTTSTRLLTSGNKLAFVVVYLFPVIYLNLYFGNNFFSGLYLSVLLIAVTYSVYEIGYIYNDAITIKKELKPTKRLSKLELEFFNKYKFFVFSLRLCLLVALLLFVFFNVPQEDFELIIYFSMLLLFLFLLYNNIRSRLSLLLHFFLVSLRYLIPMSLFLNEVGSVGVLMILAIYPILNTFERASESRFNIINSHSFLISHRYHLRSLYYGVGVILSICFFWSGVDITLPFLVVFSLLFLSRTVVIKKI